MYKCTEIEEKKKKFQNLVLKSGFFSLESKGLFSLPYSLFGNFISSNTNTLSVQSRKDSEAERCAMTIFLAGINLRTFPSAKSDPSEKSRWHLLFGRRRRDDLSRHIMIHLSSPREG